MRCSSVLPARRRGQWLALVWLFVWLAVPAWSAPLDAVFRGEKLAEMDQVITNAIAEARLPGAVLWVERSGTAYHRAYGQRALKPKPEAMTEDTIFDLASLTKVVATAPSVMLLIERGKVKLEVRVQDYIPEFRANGKDEVTIRHLLTHTSGLRSGLGRSVEGPEMALRFACQEKPVTPPGTAFCYSDINFIVLGEVVRRVSRRSLDEFAAREFYRPLQMRETAFKPSEKLRSRIAPTTGAMRGTVHDPTARGMGGVAGSAGVFSTAADLARFCRMMLNGGELDGVRVLKAETVRLMTSLQTPPSVVGRRGLGWDIDTGFSRRGDVFPIGSYGHTGFTGTLLWLDPFSKTFVIFLCNRVHPDGHGEVRKLWTTMGTLAAEAVVGFDFKNVPGALPALTNAPGVSAPANGEKEAPGVFNGIDVLKKQSFAPLKGLRLGLITNHTGHDRERNSTIDLLHAAPGVTLKALFSPEHGLRGALDTNVTDSADAKTGLPVYSLYGARRSPTPEQLAGLDALVFDIQDIGCRFYTYISTMGLCLEAAAQAKLKFFVLDRVNPINGLAVEGPVYEGKSSFTAFHALPLRHGMTVGELARLFNTERGWHADLTVIPLQGWRRGMWFDEAALPWTNPSPNMRSLTAATLYPGVGLLESAVSVGRGTETPFELVGAPYIDEAKLAAALNAAQVPGVRFEATRFTPNASVFQGQPCGGVRIVLTDRAKCAAVDVGLALALELERLYPTNFALEKVNMLLQDRATLEAIRAGQPRDEIKQAWAAGLEKFKPRREACLLYP